jgi:hypothetical protein
MTLREETPMPVEDLGLEDVILHLPASLRDRAEEMASRECVSLNLFVLMAVAEKLQRMQLEYCFGSSDDRGSEGEGASDPWLRVH